jgi:hypothetical protein
MTINGHSGPADALQVIGVELARRSHNANRLTSLGGSPQVTSPLPVYQLTLMEASQPSPLKAASLTGWYYPIIGGVTPGVAHVHQQGGKSVYGGMTEGVLPARLMLASYLADQQLGTSAQRFEPRILLVNALRIAMLWLHGTDVQEEYAVPLLEGSPPGSAPLRVVSDLTSVLGAAATARRAVPPGGGRGPTN